MIYKYLKFIKIKKSITFFLFIPSILFSQYKIEGIIIQENSKKIISGANIYVNSQENGTFSNNKGVFKLKLSKKIKNNDTLIISHIGYITKKITFFNFKKNNYTIFLKIKSIKIR